MTRVVDTPSGPFTFFGVLPTKNDAGISTIKKSDSPPPGPPDHQVSSSEDQSLGSNSTLSISPPVAPLGENFSRPSSTRPAAKIAKTNIALCLNTTTQPKKLASATKVAETHDASGPDMVDTEDFDVAFDEESDFAYDEDVSVLQDTISRLHDRLEAAENRLSVLLGENAILDAENSSLKTELHAIKSSIASSVAAEVFKATSVEVNRATSVLSAQIESLSQMVKTHSEYLVDAKIVDRRALNMDIDPYSVDPQDLYSSSAESWAAMSSRKAPAPAPSPVRAPTLAPVPKRQKTTAEDYKAMSPKTKNGFFASSHSEKSALPGLKLVHVEGFCTSKFDSVNMFSAIIEGEYGFPSKNIKHISTVSARIIECVIVADSYSAFEKALSAEKCKLTLLDSFNVSVPLSSAESVPQALENFKKRLTKNITRLSSSQNPLLRKIATLLVNYRDNGDRSWTPPPRPTLTYNLSDYVKVSEDIEMRSDDASSATSYKQ